MNRPRASDESRYARFARQSDGSYGIPEQGTPGPVPILGSGQIGGKARGLLYVLHEMSEGRTIPQYQDRVRFPRSAVLATELFDDFMRANRLGDVVEAGCESREALGAIRPRFLASRFPDRWLQPLAELLVRHREPLVVRSSSVMEDDPDHSFAGIYLSEFLPNRGSDDARLARLVEAIKDVYASTFGSNARAYRKRHHLSWREEKMAILIQDMVGRHYPNNLFYPLVAGVSFSFNYYPWTSLLSATDGTVRLVVGTGTRAVGREYARVFSLARPGLRPEGNDVATIVKNSQETVDVLDMGRGRLAQRNLSELENPLLAEICSIAREDGSLIVPPSLPLGGSRARLVASFDRLIEGSRIMPFTPLLRALMDYLEDLLALPVDVEFAVDFPSPEAERDAAPQFYVLQVRPLDAREHLRPVPIPEVPRDRVLLECRSVLGNGVRSNLRHVVYVDPATYRHTRGYDVARAVGRINDELEDEPYVLIGPGRWASSNPQLGVPVQYGEIVGAAVIVEMSTEGFAPELSYGTHFYADMVTSGVLYLPFYETSGDWLHRELLQSQRVLHSEEGVVHYVIPQGLTAYVDGVGGRGIVVLDTDD